MRSVSRRCFSDRHTELEAMLGIMRRRRRRLESMRRASTERRLAIIVHALVAAAPVCASLSLSSQHLLVESFVATV